MPRRILYPVTNQKSVVPRGEKVALRCHDCGHEYLNDREEYVCPECEGDVGLAPMGRQRVALN